MNTMYRNDKDGYQQVKDTIISHSGDILASPSITNKALFRAQLLDESEYEDKEKNFIDKLYSSAQTTQAESDSEKREREKEEKMLAVVDKNFGDLTNAPKALLHVHSTVGLSLEKLGELIKWWNDEQVELEKEKKEEYIDLKIYYATVKTPDYDEAVQNVLLYGTQVDLLKKDGLESGWKVEGTPQLIEEKDWFEINMASFYLPGGNDITQNWTAFDKIFMRTGHLFFDRGFYEEYHKRFFEECLEDNIRYVELRTGFVEFSNWENREEIKNSILFFRPDFSVQDCLYHADMVYKLNPVAPDAKFLELMLRARNSATKDNPERLGVKVILTANRNKVNAETESMAEAGKKVDAAIAIKNGLASSVEEKNIKAIADMVIGFDFVNKEEASKGLTDILSQIIYAECSYENTDKPKLNKLKGKCRMQLMRFFFHDGESTAEIGDNCSNAVTGPICSRYRIGHGFQMGTAANLNGNGKHIMRYILNGYKSDADKPDNYPVRTIGGDSIRKDYITEPVIELCPISNYKLGYVDGLYNHPAISLIENGILAVICSDDPQIFGSKGLSKDYAMMYIALKRYFDDKYGKAEIVKIKAYEYLKISVFLGFFYEEMSSKYYIVPKTDDDITVVNDDLTMEDEWNVFTTALVKFKRAWSEYIKNPGGEE